MTSPSRTCARCNDDCHAIRHQLETELSQSRDDALEEAAMVVELRAGVGPYAESMGAHRTLTSAADAIRSLKAKPAPIGDALDAARYRQLKSMPHTTCFDNHIWFQPSNFDKPINVKMIGHTELDNALDAAIRKGAE